MLTEGLQKQTLTLSDLNKDQKIEWEVGRLISICIPNRGCLENKLAHDKSDYELNVLARTKDWVEKYYKENGREI